MLPATVMRRLEALGAISGKGKRLNGLFRLMENPILWYEAYANIYANDGAMTPGAGKITLDGFSEERVASIITRLKSGTYHFQPTRRVYVPKKNGKKRPLGISSGDDKLVQEVVRIILERIYEPIFETSSHGFRPGRSPHTALDQIGEEWTAIKWIIDMDIRSYFDTMNHDLLLSFLQKKIEDHRFIGLIKAMLDAGYLEEWSYHQTYSGVPQGSIASPILANIYLHEFDLFMKGMKERFNVGAKRKLNKNYLVHSYTIRRLSRKWKNLKGKEASKKELRAVQKEIKRVQQQRRKLPSGDPFDSDYKRLHYCRYADDYVIGIIGSRADAEAVREEVKRYIQETLKLTIAEEKSHICHSKEGVNFVGYQIKTYSGDRIVKVRRGLRHTTCKSVSERLQLHIPPGKLQQFCEARRYGNYRTTQALHRPELLMLSDAEIILAYNGELRGLANYYSLAQNVKREMNRLGYLWRGSLFKTLAHKHKTSVMKISKQLKTEDGHVLTVYGEKKDRVIRVFRLKDLKPPRSNDPRIDQVPNTFALTLCRSELIRRLNTQKCEYCEATQGPFEVHHVRKLKDVARGKAMWQKMMIARHRKTLVLCVRCHHLLHAGTLPDRESLKAQVNGEPGALKGASPGSGRGARMTH
jgi:group II intron reverse transcriptase/maturase